MKTMRMYHWIALYEGCDRFRPTLRSHPATGGMPEMIDDMLRQLRAAEAVRAGRGPEVAAAEALDDARSELSRSHRLAYGLASAFAAHGPAELRADIGRMVRFVWPDKLKVVQRSFTETASSAATFRERAREAVAAPGHAAMQGLVPGWPRMIDAIPAATEAFAAALAALESSRQDDVWSPATGRQEARALFQTLRTNLRFAGREGDPAFALARSGIERRFRELRAQAREAMRRGEGPEDAEVVDDADEGAEEAADNGRPPVPDAQDPISAPVGGGSRTGDSPSERAGSGGSGSGAQGSGGSGSGSSPPR